MWEALLARARRRRKRWRWFIVGGATSPTRWLFAVEQRLRRLPSVRRWARVNGWPQVGTRGRVPLAAVLAYRRRFLVLTPIFIGRRPVWRRARRGA